MKEVVIQAFCDRHWRGGEKVPAPSSFTVTVDGVELTLDLCEDCATPIQFALDLFAELGNGDKPKRKGPKPKRTDCAICGHVNNTRSALASHYKRVHHMSIQEAEESD